MEIQQIQDSIVAAFGNVAAPNPGKIIREMDSKSLRDAEQFRQIIAGRNWTNLDSDFLNKWWSSYYYLSPEAYCYYLPALLIGALKELPNALGLMNLVMFSIRPSFWEIYYNGEDHEFNLQQMNYTEAQFRSVCAFLGMVFESIPHERHRAAQALYWGWNRYDTPELEAANRYYLEMRSFAYPESDDPEIARLFKVIRDAFADTPYPGDDNLSGSDQGDDPAENAMDLRGVKWQSAHPVLLARCYTALSFLTDAGFRYFLPAFLLENLSNYDSNVNPVFDLTRGFYDRTMSSLDKTTQKTLDAALVSGMQEFGVSRLKAIAMIKKSNEQQKETDWRDESTKRMKAFTRDERIAIILYLNYRAKDAYESSEINQALANYWIPSLQSSEN